ncbi:MAG: helix-turn-helix domain-containing protein [Xanthobacteraceae bacterium]
MERLVKILLTIYAQPTSGAIVRDPNASRFVSVNAPNGEMTMLGHQSANAANHSSLEWQEDSSRLTTIVRDLVGYTLEEVEREVILNSLDQYGGCQTYTANVLGMSIRCLRNKISQYAAMGIPVTAPGQSDDVTTVRHPPDCLSCGRPMRFERTITQVHRSPELQGFECRPCGLVVTAQNGSFIPYTQYLHS